MTDEKGRPLLKEVPHNADIKRSLTEALPAPQDPSSALSNTLKELDKARKAISLAAKRRDVSLNEALSVCNRAIAALQDLTLEAALRNLEQERDRLVQRRDDVLTTRRGKLEAVCRGRRWAVMRMAHYDYVGCFKVSYKNERVTVDVGSEMFAESTKSTAPNC